MSYKHHFSRSLSAAPGRIHLASHSHHLWPDASFEAQVRAWEDAARLADRKWQQLFAELLPRASEHVARRIGLSDGSSIAFAPSTHELVVRILSCLPRDRPLRILTTSSEFHSFARQAKRLEEDGAIVVERIPTEPFGTFTARFTDAARRGGHDLVFLSHVFFDSGWALPDLPAIVDAVPDDETYVVVDGYHAFMAMPVDIGGLSERIFYLGGGYKYAMTGEGCCFVHAPPGYGARPRNTGWFAAFGMLSASQTDETLYAPGGARFMGATFDATPLYRFDAVMRWLDEISVTPERIHAHSHRLQSAFVRGLAKHRLLLAEEQLVVPLDDPNRGNFLVFRLDSAADIQARLLAADVATDVRDDRLRLGFGLYLDEEDVLRALERMADVLQEKSP